MVVSLGWIRVRFLSISKPRSERLMIRMERF